MDHKKSKKVWKASQKYLIGGVNSPVRSFNSVDLEPIAIKRGRKCYLIDQDDYQYIDFLNSWGPNILGHIHPAVKAKIKKQINKGLSYGAITKLEQQLAQFIVTNIQHIDLIRFVNSGTEAIMTAIRLARGITQKNKIIKFDGCYHGHSDAVLVKAGSGLLTQENITTNSGGITTCTANHTIVLPLDNTELLVQTVKENHNELAAIIIEPLPANCGLLVQDIKFLKTIEKLCLDYNIIFILDEVITGFRVQFSGFAGKYNLKPDIVTYGKIIGGGFPVGAIAGKTTILQHLAPLGDIYQAGTLSGNPLAMAAGLATLKLLYKEEVYLHLNKLARYLYNMFHNEIKPLLQNKDFNIELVQEESIFWLAIFDKKNTQPPKRADAIWKDAPKVYKKLFKTFIEEKIYIAPSAYEVGFLSYPMKKKHIASFIKAIVKFLS